MGWYTREQVIEKYGYDPLEQPDKAVPEEAHDLLPIEAKKQRLSETIIQGIPKEAREQQNILGKVTSAIGALAVEEVTDLYENMKGFLSGEKPIRDPETGDLTKEFTDYGIGLGLEQTLGGSLGKVHVGPDEAVLTMGPIRRALRGDQNVTDFEDVHGVRPARTQPEQIEAARDAAGFGQEKPGNIFERGLATVDQSIYREAPIDRLARDLDIEEEIKPVTGLVASEVSRSAAFQNYFETGNLPDGTRGRVMPLQLMEAAQGLDQDARDIFSEGIVAMNTRDRRNDEIDRLNDLLTNNNPGTQPHTDALQSLTNRINDVEDARVTFKQLSDTDVTAAITRMNNDPRVQPIVRAYEDVNRDLTEFEYNNGLISNETALERLRRPWHHSLFEHRDVNVLPDQQPGLNSSTNINVERTIDPFAEVALKTIRTIDRVQINRAKDEIIRTVEAADPNGEQLRILGPAANYGAGRQQLPFGGKGTVRVYRNGVEYLAQFSRPAVAEALQFQAVDIGIVSRAANHIRKGMQSGTTGTLSTLFTGLAAPVRALGYDLAAGYLSRPAGRSYGYGSLLLRMAAGQRFDWLVDKIDVLDPTHALAAGSWVVKAPLWNMWGKTGARIMRDATRDDSFLGQFATTPQGQQFLYNVGSRMYQAFELSAIGTMKRHLGLTPHAMMRASMDARTRYMQYAERFDNAQARRPGNLWSNITRNPAASIGRELFDAYGGLLDSIYNASKYAYLAQNLALQRHRNGGRVTPRVERRLVEEARTLAGDLGAQPGSNAVAAYEAWVPYSQIAINSMRYHMHAAFGEGINQTANVALRTLALGSAMYATTKFVAEMGEEAEEWYYEVQNDFERVGKILIPTPENVMNKAQTGKWLPFNPERPRDNFYTIPLAAELVPFVEAVRAGYEAFGLIDRGANRGDTSSGKDVMTGVAGAANIASAPALNLILGQKFDMMAPLTGRAQMQPAAEPRGQGANTGNLPSGIPAWAPEAAQSIMGVAGRMTVMATDAGMQVHQEGGTLLKAIERGMREVKHEFVTKQPSVPGLWKGEDKVYLGSAKGARINEVARSLETVDKQWQLEFSKAGSLYPNSPLLADKKVAMMVAHSHQYFSRGPYKKAQEAVNQVRAKLTTLDAGKAKLGPDEIAAERRKLVKQLRSRQDKLLDIVELHDKMLQKRFGPILVENGVEPNIEGVVELSKKFLKPRQ